MKDITYLISTHVGEAFDIQCCTSDFHKFKKYLSFALLYTPISDGFSGTTIKLSIMVDGRYKYSIFPDNTLRLVEHLSNQETKLITDYGRLEQHATISRECFNDFEGFLGYETAQSGLIDAFECNCADRNSTFNCCSADIGRRGFITMYRLDNLNRWIDFVKYKIEHQFLHPILVDLIDLLSGEGKGKEGGEHK
jgi:hypothetical protein